MPHVTEFIVKADFKISPLVFHKQQNKVCWPDEYRRSLTIGLALTLCFDVDRAERRSALGN